MAANRSLMLRVGGRRGGIASRGADHAAPSCGPVSGGRRRPRRCPISRLSRRTSSSRAGRFICAADHSCCREAFSPASCPRSSRSSRPARPGGCLLAAGGLPVLVAVQQLDHLLADPAQVRAQLDQHLRRDAVALMDQAEQDVLGTDVVVVEHPGLAFSQDDHMPRPVSKSLEQPRAAHLKLARSYQRIQSYAVAAAGARQASPAPTARAEQSSANGGPAGPS